VIPKESTQKRPFISSRGFGSRVTPPMTPSRQNPID
jgi:hypothetical protein